MSRSLASLVDLSASHRAGHAPHFIEKCRKRSEGKAVFAVAHTLIVIIWHVLQTGSDYQELGANYFDRRNDSRARQRYLIRELEKLGNQVTLTPAA